MSDVEQPILTSTQGRVGIITLNRPAQMNALNDALMSALGEALLAFDRDDNIGAIVITGNDKAFAAGADIAAMADWTYQDVVRDQFVTRNWETIRQVRKPVIAAVAGFALGGGCELALACDIIVAADCARFALPETRIGTIPGAGGTQRLTRVVGKALAMDMILTGRVLTAEEARAAGLVARVEPDDAYLDTALALAAQIARASRPVVMLAKEAVNKAYETALQEGIHLERRLLYATFALEDRREGMAAFAEKRKPQFRNR